MKRLLLLLAVVFYGCTIENVNYLTPIVVTDEPQNVLATSVTLGGRVWGEGGKDVSEYGIVWATNPAPTPNDNKIVKGTRLGFFSDTYSVFEPGTTYYYRAYAINEVGVGYGYTYQFTMGADAPCNPVQDNRVDLSTSQIDIDDIDISYPSWGFDDGNVQLETSTYSSTARITVQFNEIDSRLPMTGEYTVVIGEFGNGNDLSTGEAKLFITDYGFGPGGATAVAGTKFYVKNENNKLTIIFCDTPVGDPYVLNGKFTYNY